MADRPVWRQKILDAWSRRRIVWLAGARRLGKTTLVKSLEDVVYFDCELPSVRRDLLDAEVFLEAHRGRTLALDEIHRLPNPSELLKIAADHFPEVRIVATGSSTLGASARFRDTLTGRKRAVKLSAVLFRELDIFGGLPLKDRLLCGGLPEHLLGGRPDGQDFVEWTESFWARDVLELFSVAKRFSFLRFLELLWAQSGGLCQLTSFTAACEASRQTLANYLEILSATGVVRVLRPLAANPQREIVAMPKVYGFDTGFICHARGWSELRPEDCGILWEHLVLDELLFELPEEEIYYWREKRGAEVDFVWKARGRPPVAIDCKWQAAQADSRNFSSFRNFWPGAQCWIIAADRKTVFQRSAAKGIFVEAGLNNLPDLIREHRAGSRPSRL